MSASLAVIRVRCENPTCKCLIELDKCIAVNGQVFCSQSCVCAKISLVLEDIAGMLSAIK